MSLAQLKQLLKDNALPGVVLVYGEEPYFVEQAAVFIRDAVVPPEARDFNLAQYHGRDFKPADVIEQALTLPVFSPRRLIHIKYLHEATAEQLDGLLSYVQAPVPETVLLLTAAKIDARRKFFQEVRKTGHLLEFKKIYDNQLPGHVREMGAARGVSFTGDALKLFCKRVGTSLVEVQGELEKLCSYLGDRDLVEAADVAAVVSDTRIESIFMLMDALGRAEQDTALRLLNRLLAEGQAPLMILSMIARHFRQLWKARSLQAQGVPQKDMPRRVGISPYFLKGLLEQSQRYDDADFREAFKRFLATDQALKSSGAKAQAHLESLIWTLGALGGKEKRSRWTAP